MKIIYLNRGYSTKVDDEDFEKFAKYNWYASMITGNLRVRRHIQIDGKNLKVYLHREIMNAPKGMVVDHINHDTLDNKKSNLRICTQAQNVHNETLKKSNSSGYKGVYWSKATKKWGAYITKNYYKKSLGFFNIKEEAAQAYNQAAIKLHKEFAFINKI